MMNEYHAGPAYYSDEGLLKCDIYWKGKSNSKFVYDPRPPMPRVAQIYKSVALFNCPECKEYDIDFWYDPTDQRKRNCRNCGIEKEKYILVKG